MVFFFFTSLELTANCIKYSYTISKKGLISYNVGEGEGGKYLAQFLGTSCWNQCKKNGILYCCDVLNIPFYQESINKRGKLVLLRAPYQFTFGLFLVTECSLIFASPYSRASKFDWRKISHPTPARQKWSVILNFFVAESLNHSLLCATSLCRLRDELDEPGKKRETFKLEQQRCCATSWTFLLLVFQRHALLILFYPILT